MSERPQGSRPHIVLQQSSVAQQFTAHGSPRSRESSAPKPDRLSHGEQLMTSLRNAATLSYSESDARLREEMTGGIGVQITFVGFPDVALAFEQLASDRANIELLSVLNVGDTTSANVYIPDGKLEHFEKYITAYLESRKDRNGKAADHSRLLNTIQTIRAAELQAFWTDELISFPSKPHESIWWEVWLPIRNNKRNEVLADFRKLAKHVNCTVSDHHVCFPERTVVLLHGSRNQLTQSVLLLNCIAELRRAKTTAEFFDAMLIDQQRDSVKDVLSRLSVPEHDDSTPRICLIDTGVNRAHPLLSPFIGSVDMHTVDTNWGLDDRANHGTGQAGLALFGDLTPVLSSRDAIQIRHLLESSKIIQGNRSLNGTAAHHAYLFERAVLHPEIVAPGRLRLYTSAVTAEDSRDRGRPSSWSAMVDQLSSDGENGGESPRLFVLAAGNTYDSKQWQLYPDCLYTNQIHDPAQSWNALTIGAFTELVTTENDTLKPIANEGGLSPYTTTSTVWDRAWPLKPDVVFEGGNVGRDHYSAIQLAPLSLLTTNADHLQRLFTTSNATSAASALCARMAAQIMTEYPHLRPETVRGLIVHSAEWTDDMRRMFLKSQKSITKKDVENIIRLCGWGAPNLSRALWSLNNSLTLIAEDRLSPFVKEYGQVKTRDMNLHALPWPTEQLEELQNTRVKMRVTLSYFVEPNPSARGSSSKYHYPSHRLRFDVKRPTESGKEFARRVNRAAELADEGIGNDTTDSDWYLGLTKRHRGSLHQDVWEGDAVDLASRGTIAVYPVKGWWATRPKLARYDRHACYSLIVSIQTEQKEVDLYTPIANLVNTPIPTLV